MLRKCLKLWGRRSIASSLIAAVAVFTFSHGGLAQKTNTATFKIGMVTFAGYAPLYLAKEKGFFGDLTVELQRI